MHRESQITQILNEVYDTVIVGGGIHGACIARESTLRGLKVLLLEAGDFSSGSSSRSSKMLHGGLRYLEKGDFSLVREALQERAITINSAPYLSRPQEFYCPIIKGLSRPAWQMRIGLTLYDLLTHLLPKSRHVTKLFPKYKVIEDQHKNLKKLREMGLSFSSVVSYFDGQMDDARIVIENLLDASEKGADVLNYAPVNKISRTDSEWEIEFKDIPGEKLLKVRANTLVNVSGPWIKKVHELYKPWNPDWPEVSFSRGIHILFDYPWDLPGLILPMGPKGRYYFIWPYMNPDGKSLTLVGTTERKVAEPEFNPQARPDEIEELLGYLKRDFPNSGLIEDSMYYSFCGLRVLARESDSSKGKVSDVSRKEFLIRDDKYVGVLGGKYTAARAVSDSVVDIIQDELGHQKEGSRSAAALLPGSVGYSRQNAESLITRLVQEIELQSKRNGDNLERSFIEDLARSAFNRFGMRAEALISPDYKQHMVVLDKDYYLLEAEVMFAGKNEWVSNSEDLLRRRLSLTLSYGENENISSKVMNLLSKECGMHVNCKQKAAS